MIRQQLVRYILVGLASNGFIYLVYLLLTSLGLGHKSSMTLLYAAAVLLTFLLNRHWTFEHRGASHKSFPRYVATYIAGYVFNLGALYLLVDRLGLLHQVVQGALIFVVAGGIFVLQKFWVFADLGRSAEDYAV